MKSKRKGKTPPPHPASGKAVRLLVAGVPVSLILDDDGRPRTACVPLQGDSPDEARAAWLAANLAMQTGERGAKRQAHRQGQIKAAENRREVAAGHWSLEWLQAAHAEYPKRGAKHLAAAAQRLVRLNRPQITTKELAEITEYRAKVFLRDTKPAK
jgi:hypothetical protein